MSESRRAQSRQHQKLTKGFLINKSTVFCEIVYCTVPELLSKRQKLKRTMQVTSETYNDNYHTMSCEDNVALRGRGEV